MIPLSIYSKLSNPIFHRKSKATIRSILSELHIYPGPDFVAFFETFVGPIGSDEIGYLLLDLIEDTPSILTSTNQLREIANLPHRYLVISDLLGNGLLVYDCNTDAVFDVDFEGGIDLLLEGMLIPRWSSFDAFLSDFFCC